MVRHARRSSYADLVALLAEAVRGGSQRLSLITNSAGYAATLYDAEGVARRRAMPKAEFEGICGDLFKHGLKEQYPLFELRMPCAGTFVAPAPFSAWTVDVEAGPLGDGYEVELVLVARERAAVA